MSGLSPFTIRHSLILLALLVRLASAQATPLFATNGPAVREVRLQLRDASAQSLRDNPRAYVRAELRIDETKAIEVGVHLKGATGSFRRFDDRPSLTLDLDRFRPGQNLDGFTKLHLNNSAEDPSRLNELLGHELFGRVGLPSPQVGHARLRLNGRDLGLYVLKEGFTDAFLRREFPDLPGTLLEPIPGTNGVGRWREDARTAEQAPAQLNALADICALADPAERARRFEAVLERERFATFIAAEVLLAHRDGYALAGNNYRLFLAADSGRATFLPTGMDQLFAAPELPVQPQFSGPVARAWANTPEGRQRYGTRVRELFPILLDVPALTNRIAELANRLRPYLSVREWTEVRDAAAGLAQQVVRRGTVVRESLAPPPQVTLAVGESVLMEHWQAERAPEGARLTLVPGPDQQSALHILAGPTTAVSWRTTVNLPPGRYRFAAQIATRAVQPLPFGRNQGAALRVTSGALRVGGVLGSQPWRPLELDFETDASAPPVELRLELRAAGGEVWFARDSLRLLRRP